MAQTREQQIAQRIRERIRNGWPVCSVCNTMIPFGRLESYPDTEHCVQHSRERAYVGVPNYAHKTAATVAMVKPDPDADDGMGESVRILMETYKRKR